MALHHQLPIYKLTYDLLTMAVDVTRNIPRDFKRLIGEKVREECVAMMVLIFRTTRRKTVKRACRQILTTAPEKLRDTTNSYFGLLRQATHSHRDRTKLAKAAFMRRRAVDINLTKIIGR